MPYAVVVFRQCYIDHMSLWEGREFLIARVYFTLDVAGVGHNAMVEVRQPIGANYFGDELEVRLPEDAPYRGPFPTDAVFDAVRGYMAKCVGEGGVFGIDADTSGTLSGNTVSLVDGPHAFEIPEFGGGWTPSSEFVRVPRSSTPDFEFVVHEGQSFESQIIHLDGRDFRGCRFLRCRLVIRGLVPFRLTDNDIDECSIELAPPASYYIPILRMVYHANPEGARMVEATFEEIRQA